jgi:hypothetical protein
MGEKVGGIEAALDAVGNVEVGIVPQATAATTVATNTAVAGLECPFSLFIGYT